MIPQRLLAFGLALLLAMPVSLRPAAAGEDYRLDAGDVLEIAVFGVADFRRRVTVNIDGNLSVPFLGEVPASGQTLAQVRVALAKGLAATGRIQDPDVTIEMVEHRPFYILGDVSRPGALPYRPGLTVRHAVALAGGYDALRFRFENPVMTSVDLQSEQERLWLDFLRQSARSASLKAELDGKGDFDLGAVAQAPVPRRVVEEIAGFERRDLRLRIDDQRKEAAYLGQTLDTARRTVAELEDSMRQSQAAIENQERAQGRMETFAARGVTPAQRLEEERRALATLRAQQVDLNGRLVVARRERDEIARRIDRLADERKSRLVQAQRDVSVEIEALRSRLQASGEKLLYAGAVKAQMQRGTIAPDMLIHRRGPDGVERITAGEDTEILPGDVLDVVIRPDRATLAAGNRE